MNSVAKKRIERGMTQKELADKIGADVRWVQKIEHGDISLENVTFLRGIKLLLALEGDDPDEAIQDCCGCVKTTYIMLREYTSDAVHCNNKEE